MAARAVTSKDVNGLSVRTYPLIESGAASPLALLRRLGTRYAENRRYRQTVAELARLSDDLLADIGIGRYQIHEVARTSSRKAA